MKIARSLVISTALFGLVALTVTATGFGLAQQDDSSRWIEQRVAKRIVSRIEARLNMTIEQREQVKAVLKAEEPTILALAERGKIERDELVQMQTFDEPQVHDVARRYAATNTDILVERAKVRMELLAVLNDAQRQQLEAMRAKLGAHFAERLDSLLDAI
jgi:Spy/CpxP family protein refolding chaperone